MPKDDGGVDPDEITALLEQYGFGGDGGGSTSEDYRLPLGGRDPIPDGSRWGSRWRNPWDGTPGTRPAYRDEYTGKDPTTGAVIFQPGDSFRILQKLPEEQMVRIQEMMVGAGIISAKGLLPGYLDQNTILGFNQILTTANHEGKSWERVVADYTRAVDSGQFDEPGERYIAPAYMAPDYATLAQKVKGTMREVLGRDPDEAELAALVGELQGWDRQAYEQEVAADEAEFDADVAGEEQPAGSFQQVDPLARFQESFEQKYAKEIDFVEERDEVVPLSQESVGGGVDTLSSMSRDA